MNYQSAIMKIQWTFFYGLIIYITRALADDSCILQHRINQIKSFSANFVQSVKEFNGNIIYESKGTVWIKKPNQFYWHTILPDESMLVSDGITLWFYTPMLKQVTIQWLHNIIDDTLFMFMFNNVIIWKQYNIQKQEDYFTLIPKHHVKNLKKFNIHITHNGIIHSITITTPDEQCNIYHLKNHNCKPIKDTKFRFLLPKNITLDDQRSYAISK